MAGGAKLPVILGSIKGSIVNGESLVWLKFGEFTYFAKHCLAKALSCLIFADILDKFAPNFMPPNSSRSFVILFIYILIFLQYDIRIVYILIFLQYDICIVDLLFATSIIFM